MSTHYLLMDKEVYCVSQYEKVTEDVPDDIIFGIEGNDFSKGKCVRYGGGQVNQE